MNLLQTVLKNFLYSSVELKIRRLLLGGFELFKNLHKAAVI